MNAQITAPDLVLHRGLFTTLDRSIPTANAAAIKDGRFLAFGRDAEIMRLAGKKTRAIDLKGCRILPGLIDNHLHIDDIMELGSIVQITRLTDKTLH